MRIRGKMQHGVYLDDCAEMHPRDIQLFYGVDRRTERVRHNNQTGAGHPLDEESDDDSDWSDVNASSADHSSESTASENNDDDIDEVTPNIRHPPIKPASYSSPFYTKQATNMFYEASTTLASDFKVGWCTQPLYF
jgi:hypothetical protein